MKQNKDSVIERKEKTNWKYIERKPFNQEEKKKKERICLKKQQRNEIKPYTGNE